MSNDMNNEQNKAAERELEKKLNKAFDDVSEEATSPQLDASIMAMAQQEVEARDSGKEKKSWWDRLKMPVSLTAALVVTVGIARFMVELGYYSPNSISEGENLGQPSDFKKVSAWLLSATNHLSLSLLLPLYQHQSLLQQRWLKNVFLLDNNLMPRQRQGNVT